MNYLEFIVKVQQVAKIGLKYSTDEYALDNYQELEKLSREMLNNFVQEPIQQNIFTKDIYPTPSSSVRVMVFNEKNQILMVKEKQDGKWSIPGGWCEIFLDLKDNAVKEVKEESGLDIEIVRLLAIFRREKYKDYPTTVSEYIHYFAGKIKGGTLKTNHETCDVGFFDFDQLPPLSRKNTVVELTRAYHVLKNNLEVDVD